MSEEKMIRRRLAGRDLLVVLVAHHDVDQHPARVPGHLLRLDDSGRLNGVAGLHRPSGQLHGPVIIAMISMRMVQPAVDEIVDMITMRHRFMSAVWTVRMCAVDLGRALLGICRVDRDDMLVHVIFVHMVEMAVVKIIQMAVMTNRRVPATRAVLMGVIGVVLFVTCGHWQYSLRSAGLPSDATPTQPSVE
ncbi:hypothetical protein LJR220_004625 [Bradyrhizobium sp. LjRoot220]|uniref:hypothetical protein n=1 Tax=Bradyrhizobium sp. LjRoot220 TaxID=3342284 RepID=UPI003ECECAB0